MSSASAEILGAMWNVRVASDALLALPLPKWTPMSVRGAPIGADRAREVIRRTDGFFREGAAFGTGSEGSDLARRLRMPDLLRGNADPDDWDPERWDRESAAARAWAQAWGVLDLRFLSNYRVGLGDAAFGPAGWCAIDGAIEFDRSIGRSPRIEEVVADWARIATAFPFLDLAATLTQVPSRFGARGVGDGMEGEELSVGAPIATILVRDGWVDLVSGDLSLGDRFPPIRRGEARVGDADPDQRRIPEAWLEAWEQMGQEIALRLRDGESDAA